MSRVDANGLRGECPVSMFEPAQQCDPIELGRIPFDDLVRAIGRSVAYDDPLRWQVSLRYYGSDRVFNQILLIASCRHQDTGQLGLYGVVAEIGALLAQAVSLDERLSSESGRDSAMPCA